MSNTIPLPALATEQARHRQKPFQEKVGSVAIPIYRTHWRKKSTRKRYESHVIIWRDADGRHKEKRATLEAARQRARQIATDILNGQAAQSQFTEADRASYRRALELLQPWGRSLEVAAADYADCLKMLDGQSLRDACRFFIEHQPKVGTPINAPEIITEMIDEKRRLGKGHKWLSTLKQQLTRFGEKFNCPLHMVRAHEITSWLDGLKVGLRSRKNYRDAVRELIRYAQAKGHLSRTWDELKHVEDASVPPVEVEIYTPEQIRRLLIARQDIEERGRSGGTLMPFLLLQVFAGIRHEEMSQRGRHKAVLDWSCIDLDKGFIRVRAIVGKTKRMRLIHIHPNLSEWLRPYAKTSGPICELSQTAGALDRAKKLAKLPNQRGQLTNALRSSFISYRLAETNDIALTAREAGNSPQVIQSNYLELATPAMAKEFWSTTPSKADILPLFAWATKE